MADGRVTIETILDSKKFKKALNDLSGTSVKGLGAVTKAVAGTGSAITALAGMATKAGIEYESAFAGVKKTVNASKKEFDHLSDGIRNLAKHMPESAAEIAHVAEAAGQLGIEKKSILSFTKTMTQLGDATNMSSEEAADSLARIANITGMSQKNFGRLGSTVVALGNNLATTEKEIVAMSMRIAGAGHQVGMHESQITSFAAALSSVGIEAEAGGTAFSSLMSKMNLAVSKGGQQLGQFAKVAGLSADEFKSKFKQDASGAILSFIQGLGKIKEQGGSAIKTLDDMGLSDIRMRDALLRASGASDVFTKALKLGSSAWEENTALTNEVKNRYGTLESRLKMLKNTAVDFGIEMYHSTKGPLNSAVTSATKALEKIQDGYKKHGMGGASKAAGEAIADMAVQATKGLPKLTEMGGKALSAFAQGLYKNRGQLAKAAASTVRALAGAIAGLLPSAVGNSLKNLAGVAIAVAKPLLVVAGAALKVAASMSGLAPVVLGVVAAFKLHTALSSFALALKLVQVGQKANTASTVANTTATLANVAITKTKAAVATFSAAREAVLTAAQTANTAATASGTVATVAHTTAVQAHGIAAGTAAVATKAFAAATAFLAGPAGIAIVAVGALAGLALTFSYNSDKASGAAEREAASIKRLKSEVDDLSDSYRKNAGQRKDQYANAATQSAVVARWGSRLEELAEKRNKSNREILEEKAAVEMLNTVVPGLNLKYNEQKDALNMTTDALHRKIEAAKEEAKVSAAKELMVDAYKDQLKQEAALAKASKKRQQAEKAFKEIESKTQGGKYTDAEAVEFNKRLANLKAADEAYKKVKKTVEESKNEVKSYEDILMRSMSGGTALIEKAKRMGIRVPKAIADGVKAGGAKAKTATSWLERSINFTVLSKKARHAGVNIPGSVAKGMKSGKIRIPASVSELNSLIKFEKAVSRAKKAGVAVPDKLVSGVRQGKAPASKAAKELSAKIDLKSAEGKAKKSGAKTGESFSSGVKGKRGSAESAGKALASRTHSGADSKTSEFSTIGSNMGAGLVSGISGWLTEALNAGAALANSAVAGSKSKKGSDSHSPSRKTKTIGRYLGQGLIVGMRSYTGRVKHSAASLIGDALKSAKNPKGGYEKIGQAFTQGLSKALESRQSKLNKRFSGVVDKAVRKAGKSKETKKAARSLVSDYSSALKGEGKKLMKSANETVSKLSQSYQEKYSNLKERREALKDQLRDYGDMLAKEVTNFEASFGSISEGSPFATMRKRLRDSAKFDKLYNELKNVLPQDLMAEILASGDTEALKTLRRISYASQSQLDDYIAKYKAFKKNIEKINSDTASGGGDVLDTLLNKSTAKSKFKSLLNKLKQIGASPELRDAVINMGVEDGSKFLENFFAMSEDRRRQYLRQWQADYASSSEFATDFFKDQFSGLEKSFLKDLKRATKDFTQSMKNLGSSMMKGLISSITARAKDAKKAVRDVLSAATGELEQAAPKSNKAGKKSSKKKKGKVKKKAPKKLKSSRASLTSFDKNFAAFVQNDDAVSTVYTAAQNAVFGAASVKPLSVRSAAARSEAAAAEGENKVTEVHIHTELDGRELSHKMVRFIDKDLARLMNQKERGL